MAESNFGIMELLQKLFKERGKGVSKEEQGVMGKATGKGYESFIDKNKFTAGNNYQAGEMKTIDPLENTLPYSNATTNALSQMRDLQTGQTGVGAVSNYELDQFKKASQYVDDGALSGWLTNQLPALRQMGADNIDLNVPPREIRNQIDAMTGRPLGAVSDQEMQHFQGATSNVDTMFAQALNALSPREQAEIIQTTQGYTEEQVENFKIQYLQGRVSSYELERPYLQSNLGFQ